MANHTIDCPHCGSDQRTHGTRCCSPAAAELERVAVAFDREQAERQALFQQHGIEFYVVGSRREIIPRSESVVHFIRHLESL